MALPPPKCGEMGHCTGFLGRWNYPQWRGTRPTTVTVHGDGLGGRNQEFALAAARDIAGLDDVVVLSGGTDGTDGPTPAAGALADGHTVARARALRVAPDDFLHRNDS